MNSFVTWTPQRVLRSIHYRLGRYLAESDAVAAHLANDSLTRRIKETHNRINIGCGRDKRSGYLNVDVDPAASFDILIVDGDDSMIPRDHFVEVIANDVIEHIPRSKTLSALLDWADYLVEGGRLVIKTSSIVGAATKLQESRDFSQHYNWTTCLFGNQAHPGDFHFTGFTDVTLRVHLLAAGFRVDSVSLHDEWLLNAEATKIDSWTVLRDADMSDADFMKEAYRRAFFRDISEADLGHWTQALKAGVSRKAALKSVYSAPERLFRIAERNGL